MPLFYCDADDLSLRELPERHRAMARVILPAHGDT